MLAVDLTEHGKHRVLRPTSLYAKHSSLSGQALQLGAFGVHTVAPNSINACPHAPHLFGPPTPNLASYAGTSMLATAQT